MPNERLRALLLERGVTPAKLAAELDARDDLHATADYRRMLVRKLGAQTIAEAQACRV